MLQQEIQKYKRMKMKLYEDLSDGIIDVKEYQEYRSSFSQRIEEKEQALERLEHERMEAVEGNRGCNLWMKEFQRYQIAELSKEMAMQAEVDDEQLKKIENISLFAKEPALTKEMAEYIIKEVRVYRDDRYEIIWKFRNIFDEVACS